MKNLLIILSLLLSVNLFADELKWVDEQIQAIKPPRSGISKSKINAVKDPFIFLKKNKDKSGKSTVAAKSTNTLKKRSTLTNTNKVSKKSKSLSLDAIINKSALINGKWYKLGEMVGKYTLSSIERTTVILKYKSKDLFLSTNSPNKNLKFKYN